MALARAKARQMRCMLARLNPVLAAMERVDQCVASSGLDFSVSARTRSMSQSPSLRARFIEQAVVPPAASTCRRSTGWSRPVARWQCCSALRRPVNNPRPHGQSLRRLAPPTPRDQLLPLLLPNRQRRKWTTHRHGISPTRSDEPTTHTYANYLRDSTLDEVQSSSEYVSLDGMSGRGS